MHLELPIVSFISSLLSLAPLPWHWRAGTVPTISIAIWLFVYNTISGINSIIWANNFRTTALVWCDISTKVVVGANVALPASIFCLCVHLERVSSARQTSTNALQKRRRQYMDAFVCFGIPVIYMALHYVVQGHRFDIIEDFGCRASTYVSVASIFLIWIPPLTFCLGSLIYSGMAFRNFWIHRIMFARHLQNNSALTPSRYFRLMAMSLVQMFWGAGVISFNMWFTMRGGLRPWISWEDVHYNFSRVAVFPTFLIPPKVLFYTYMTWWAVPISTAMFFGFFSFGQDAIKEYRACYRWIRQNIFRVSSHSSKDKILPSYVKSSENSVGLTPMGNSKGASAFTKSEITLASPDASKFKEYQWNPPPSPSETSPTCYSPSTSNMFSENQKSKIEAEESDVQSLSSYCSTKHP